MAAERGEVDRRGVWVKMAEAKRKVRSKGYSC